MLGDVAVASTCTDPPLGGFAHMVNRISMTLATGFAALIPFACGGGSGGSATGGTPGTDAGGLADGSTTTDSGAGSNHDGGGSSGDSGTVLVGGDAGSACTGDETTLGGFPAGFWDTSNIPAAAGPVVFKFLNRTNGKYADSEVYWSFENSTLNVSETHSIADQPTYQMPTPAAGGGYNGRMYFYLCAAGSPASCPGSQGATDYYDFIEFAIGNNSPPQAPYWINYDTTRVDAFAIKLALDLHDATGPDYYTGENCATFAEDRSDTFAAFVSAVPDVFKPCGQTHAPYRIQEPGGGCGFNAGGANADYYDSYEMEMWTNNGITIPMPGPNGSGLGAYPDISAAIFRHVGAEAGTWTADGKLVDGNWWSTMPASTFYSAAPSDAYAQFLHSRAIHGKQYGFPYDDVGGNSSDVGASGMDYMIVAIGW
jgi:Beta-1,3-glucanase